MDIKNRQFLKQEAAASLGQAPNQKKIVAVYSGVSIAMAAGMWLLDTVINHAISGTGGLGNLGTRSLLQTLQSVLPILQMVFSTCWGMGYLRAMMNISRNAPADTRTLTGSFRLFGPIFRLEILQSLIYSGILIGCVYGATIAFTLTPFAQPLMDVMGSYETSMLATEMVITDEMLTAMLPSMTPIFVITFVLFAIIGGPLVYSYRMAFYCLLDDPRAGARASLRWSKAMMRNRRMELFKLDLSLWWYYVLDAAVLLISYIPMILALLGIALPISSSAIEYLFLGIYYVLFFLLHVCLRNYCEVIYVKAYDRLRIPDAPPQPVILGNIFQM